MPNELKIFGEVGEKVTAEMVRAQLAAMDQSEPLTVRFDSPGGSVSEGFAIYTALTNYEGPITGVVESAAFSIASYIAMACDDIQMASNGYLMIHNPRGEVQGDDEEMANASSFIAKLKTDMITAYSERSGIEPDRIAAMMRDESYLNASESVRLGFANSIQATKRTTGIAASALESLPYRIVASLRCDAPGGDITEPKEQPMANDKVAATVKQIKAIYPKATDKFVVKAVEQEMTEEEVKAAAMEELEAENGELKEKLEAMEEELEAFKSRAMEEEQQAKAQEEEEQQAKARAKANSPVALGVGANVSASSLWKTKVEELVSQGFARPKAVALASKRNPGLREKYLEEANS